MTTSSVVDKQPMDISLRGGVNERDRPEQVEWQKYLHKAENVILDDYFGGLTKRNGTGVIATTDEDSAAFSNVYGFVGIDGGAAFIGKNYQLYQTAELAANVVKKNRASEFGVTRTTLSSATQAYTSSSLAGHPVGVYETDKYYVYVHGAQNLGANYYAIVVVDKYSDNVVRKWYFSTATGGGSPISDMAAAVMVDRRYLHISYRRTSAAPKIFTIDFGTTLAASGLITPTTANWTAGSGGVIGGVELGSYSVWFNTSGTTTKVEIFDTSGTSVAAGSIANYSATDIDTDGTYIFLAGKNTTPKYEIRILDTGLSSINTITDATASTIDATIRLCVDPGTSVSYLVSYGRTASGVGSIYYPVAHAWKCASNDVTFTDLGSMPCWMEACKPFFNTVTGRAYVGLMKQLSGNSATTASRDVIAGCYCIVDITESFGTGSNKYFRPTAVADNYTAYTFYVDQEYGHVGASSTGWPSPMVFQSSDLYTIGLPVVEKAGDKSTNYILSKLSVYDPYYLTGDSGCISGGLAQGYDGDSVSELSFVDTPTIFVSDSGGGTGVNSGLHSYIAVYTVQDMSGNRHFSRTSRPSSLTLGANKDVTVLVIPPSVTSHAIRAGSGYASPVLKNVYRTVVGGSEFFYVGESTVLDNSSDSTISAQTSLFRQPSFSNPEKDRYHGLATPTVLRHKDRVFICSGSNVYYSSFAVDGEAPWFNPGFSFPVPGGSGPITGLASMDGLLVVFKRDAVFVVDGDGPPENGGSGTEFSTPRRINTEHGCVDPRTIVNTPDGIMYRSGRGIELLQRGLQIDSQPGSMIQKTVDANPYNGGACYDQVGGRVLWCIGSAESSDGRLATSGAIIAYDVPSKAWTTFRFTGGTPIQDVAFTDLYVSGLGNGPRTVFCTADKILYESPVKLDSGADYVPYDIETAWVHAESLQDIIELDELLVLAQKITNHDLVVSVAYDYDPTWVYTRTYRANTMVKDVEQLLFPPNRQKAMAMKFRIRDQAPADTAWTVGNGDGPEIVALTVKLGKKGGGAKVNQSLRGNVQ